MDYEKTLGTLSMWSLVWGFDCSHTNNSTVKNITFVFQKQEVDPKQESHTANKTILRAFSLHSRLGRKGWVENKASHEQTRNLWQSR